LAAVTLIPQKPLAKGALLAAVILMAGCNALPPAPLVGINPVEAASFARTGQGSVTGQAYADSGTPSRASGKTVYLVPDLPRYQDWLRRTIVEGNGPNLDPSDGRYVRQATADESGSFSFTGVPDGKYIVVFVTYWEEPDANGYMISKGGPRSQQVVVSGGAPVSVELR
jgi:hypothetical protein